MKNVIVVACGTHMASGYACSGEWSCLQAAARARGSFKEASRVVAFVSCRCPGSTVLNDIESAVVLSGIKPEAIHLSSCLVHLIPKCPCADPGEWAGMIEARTGIPVVAGTIGRLSGPRTIRRRAGIDKAQSFTLARLRVECPIDLSKLKESAEEQTALRSVHSPSIIILTRQPAAGRRLR